MTDFVAVELADGQQTTVTAAYAEAKGLKVLAGERATDKRGRALGPVSQRVETQVAANVDAEVDALKGKALNEALKAAGLPAGGTAAEKRLRLTEHRSALANVTTDDEHPPGDSKTSTEGTVS